jgi:8-oxo-dGTP pyrophosphatase MutT (NUDIX family)
MKFVVRRKVIVVPFARDGDDVVKFMVVKDRKNKEWTFVTGGCKAKESDVQAAQRELCEETRGVLDLDFDRSGASSFRFKTTYRDAKELADDRARNEQVVTTYSVFAVDITGIDFEDAKRSFRGTKATQRSWNENTDLNFETLESFSNKAHVWKFIRDHVLENQQFQMHVHRLKEHSPMY